MWPVAFTALPWVEEHCCCCCIKSSVFNDIVTTVPGAFYKLHVRMLHSSHTQFTVVSAKWLAEKSRLGLLPKFANVSDVCDVGAVPGRWEETRHGRVKVQPDSLLTELRAAASGLPGIQEHRSQGPRPVHQEWDVRRSRTWNAHDWYGHQLTVRCNKHAVSFCYQLTVRYRYWPPFVWMLLCKMMLKSFSRAFFKSRLKLAYIICS